jgi:hypothetical protein
VFRGKSAVRLTEQRDHLCQQRLYGHPTEERNVILIII